LYITLTT